MEAEIIQEDIAENPIIAETRSGKNIHGAPHRTSIQEIW